MMFETIVNFAVLGIISVPLLFICAGTAMWRIQREEYAPALMLVAVMVNLVRMDVVRYFTAIYGVYDTPRDNGVLYVASSDVAFATCQLILFVAVINLLRFYIVKSLTNENV